MRRWIAGALGALLFFASFSALAQINNGGSFSNGQTNYSNFTCTYCHDNPPDSSANNNLPGANVQAVTCSTAKAVAA